MNEQLKNLYDRENAKARRRQEIRQYIENVGPENMEALIGKKAVVELLNEYNALEAVDPSVYRMMGDPAAQVQTQPQIQAPVKRPRRTLPKTPQNPAPNPNLQPTQVVEKDVVEPKLDSNEQLQVVENGKTPSDLKTTGGYSLPPMASIDPRHSMGESLIPKQMPDWYKNVTRTHPSNFENNIITADKRGKERILREDKRLHNLFSDKPSSSVQAPKYSLVGGGNIARLPDQKIHGLNYGYSF